jgi:hypothetical protein
MNVLANIVCLPCACLKHFKRKEIIRYPYEYIIKEMKHAEATSSIGKTVFNLNSSLLKLPGCFSHNYFQTLLTIENE